MKVLKICDQNKSNAQVCAGCLGLGCAVPDADMCGSWGRRSCSTTSGTRLWYALLPSSPSTAARSPTFSRSLALSLCAFSLRSVAASALGHLGSGESTWCAVLTQQGVAAHVALRLLLGALLSPVQGQTLHHLPGPTPLSTQDEPGFGSQGGSAHTVRTWLSGVVLLEWRRVDRPDECLFVYGNRWQRSGSRVPG